MRILHLSLILLSVLLSIVVAAKQYISTLEFYSLIILIFSSLITGVVSSLHANEKRKDESNEMLGNQH